MSALFVEAGVIQKPVTAEDIFFDLPAQLQKYESGQK